MRILVCLKQVPERNSRLRLNEAGTSVLEEDLSFETSECDLYALEEALRLKEKLGGEVAILSAGGEGVLKIIKNGLAMGADRAIHLKDRLFQGGDAWMTAKVIARAIRNELFDLILTGVQSDDYGSGQTGPRLAHLLDWPHVTLVVEVQVSNGSRIVQVTRELECGICERIEVALPAVLTVQTGTNHPRYPTLKGIMQAKTKPIRILSAQDLGLRARELGVRSAREELFLPEKKKRTVLLGGPPDQAVKALVERLRTEANVL